MIDKIELKQLLLSYHNDIEKYKIVKRTLPSDEFPRRVFVGIRRAGKSFMLYQKIQEKLSEGLDWSDMLYLNFEDDRLYGFQLEDFQTLLDCHIELYGKRPMLFLDEIQNVVGWEKFARRIADSKYSAWLTGSNAKMLSSEIMTTLGGRYLSTEVYPFGFSEYLDMQGVSFDEISLLQPEKRGLVLRKWDEYLHWGGLPEVIDLSVKRDYLSSTFQKIYMGDIATRNRISNPNVLRLLLKKLAENVCQPKSYSRIANVLSSISGRITMPTVCSYIEYSESAWLLLRLRNVVSSFSEKESSCKYYFVDNGVLNLFLIDNDTSLLENMAALSLFRKYGHDTNNDRVYFYNDKVEVDFYVPEDELAIQVSYSIKKSESTFSRELESLKRLPQALPCKRRVILTYDESDTIKDERGNIEVIPLWMWMLDTERSLR